MIIQACGENCLLATYHAGNPENDNGYLEKARGYLGKVIELYSKGRALLFDVKDCEQQKILGKLFKDITRIGGEISALEKEVQEKLRTKEGTKKLSNLTINMARGIGLCGMIERADKLNREVDIAYQEVINIHKGVLDTYKKDDKSVDADELHCFVEEFHKTMKVYDDLVRKSLGLP